MKELTKSFTLHRQSARVTKAEEIVCFDIDWYYHSIAAAGGYASMVQSSAVKRCGVAASSVLYCTGTVPAQPSLLFLLLLLKSYVWLILQKHVNFVCVGLGARDSPSFPTTPNF